jgi:hypothetical protein
LNNARSVSVFSKLFSITEVTGRCINNECRRQVTV